jgi:hypothetical protein
MTPRNWLISRQILRWWKVTPLGRSNGRISEPGKSPAGPVLRGDRANNYRLRSPDGRVSKPHGMAWILEKVRPVILTR